MNILTNALCKNNTHTAEYISHRDYARQGLRRYQQRQTTSDSRGASRGEDGWQVASISPLQMQSSWDIRFRVRVEV